MFASGKKGRQAPPRNGAKGAAGLSFIGPDVVVSGDVAATGQLHIDGRVEGNVRCETLVQGDGGTIAGHIVADTVHLAGLVDGTVKARLVTLEPSARVTGDVAYETLSIAAGAAIEGRLTRKEGAPAAGPAAPEPRLRAERRPARMKADAPAKAEEPGLLAIGAAPAAG